MYNTETGNIYEQPASYQSSGSYRENSIPNDSRSLKPKPKKYTSSFTHHSGKKAF